MTVSPVATVTSAGTNTKFLIATVCARGAGREQATAPARHASAAVRCLVVRFTYFASDAWMLFARSRCAPNAGRDFSSNALSSAFCAPGISVLSIASATA